ncbi:hypothetical protein FQN57_005757 [Myotisia sp. PD_48]|nr:hypothetical protein FQN57_005757 [Myotisia sp. PD_48]
MDYFSRLAQKWTQEKAGMTDPDISNDAGVNLGPRANSKRNRDGLNLLVDPPGATVDIFALHGLNGDPFRTWTFRKNSRRVMWLKDSDMLPAAIPSARIFTYGYNANVALNTSVADIRDYALGFLTSVTAYRKTAKNGSDNENISKNVRGVLFMGTPHQGSATASFGRLFSHIASLTVNPNKQALKLLERKSSRLKDLAFEWREVYDGFRIVSCYETMRTQIVNQKISMVIVDRESAILNVSNENQVPIGADHSGICKFSGPTNNYFIVVADQLKKMILCQPMDLVVTMSEPEKYCLQALAESDYVTQRASIPSPVHKTCHWLTQHSKILQWQEKQSSSLLWLSGGPGCGKSVMASFLVDELDRRAAQPEFPAKVCYFFCDDKNETNRSATGILCAILHQLISSDYALVQHAVPQFIQKGKQFTKELKTLWDILMTIHADPDCGNIILIVDALDECEENTRRLFLDWVAEFTRKQKSGQNYLKIMITSRPEFSIARKMGWSEIQLRTEDEMDHINNDIRLVVYDRLEALNFSEKFKLHVANRLIEKADGTFLWVALILRLLEASGDSSEAGVLGILDDPTTSHNLFGVYRRILDRIPPNKMRDSKRILQIISTASRPLTTKELNIALAIQSTDTCQNDLRPRLQKNLELFLIRRCGPLIRIVNSTVQLVHQTVKEFLLDSTRLTTPTVWSITLTESHLILAQICIWYLLLLHSELGSLPGYTDFTGFVKCNVIRTCGKPLCCYSIDNWCTHFRVSQDIMEEDMIHKAVALHELFSNAPELISIRALAGAAASDHTTVVWWLLERIRTLPEDLTHGVALAYAVCQGHLSTTRFLLARPETDPNFQHKLITIPLMIAILRGDMTILRLLLQNPKIDPNTLDRYGDRPLFISLKTRDRVVVELLLKHPTIDPNMPDQYGERPLNISIKREDRAVVELLLKHPKIDPNMPNRYGDRPLFVAIKKGDRMVVELLLKHPTIDPNVPDQDGERPLHILIKNEDRAVVELLLKHPTIDPNMPNRYGDGPLFVTIKKRDTVIVELLLKHPKIDLDIPDQYGDGPLSAMIKSQLLAPAEWDKAEPLLLLLRNPYINPNMPGKDGEIPLLTATKKGDTVAVACLLSRYDINPNMSIQGRTTLHFAIDDGKKEMVAQLLNHPKTDPNIEDIFCTTPLSLAVQNTQAEAVELLLRHPDIDINSVDPEHITPLSRAVEKGSLEVVKILLTHPRIDPNIHRQNLPLLLAIKTKQQGIVKLLLAHPKIDPNIENLGRTALLWAIESGCEAIVQLLLAHPGIDPNIRDWDGMTPLSYARRVRREEMSKLLLAHPNIIPPSQNHYEFA